MSRFGLQHRDMSPDTGEIRRRDMDGDVDTGYRATEPLVYFPYLCAVEVHPDIGQRSIRARNWSKFEQLLTPSSSSSSSRSLVLSLS